MDRRTDLAIAAVVVALGVFVIAVASQISLGLYKDPVGPRAFFYGCGVVFILGGLAIVAQRLYGWRREAAPLIAAEGGDDEPGYPVMAWRVWALVLASLVYAALFRPLGYLIATPLYLVAILCLLEVRRPLSVGLTAITFTAFCYIVFAQVLDVRIPVGPLTGFFRSMGWIVL
jgi:putative tricarboxylic transport membrane protein